MKKDTNQVAGNSWEVGVNEASLVPPLNKVKPNAEHTAVLSHDRPSNSRGYEIQFE